MALKSIQLCHMDPENRDKNEYSVTVYSDDQNQRATFNCASQEDASVHATG